jgi:prephenate dehydratase
MKRFRFTAPILAAVLFLASCGPAFITILNTARAVVFADAPVLNRLEQRGVITHAQNVAIDGFLKATGSNIDLTRTEWTAAGADKVKQVAAVQASVNREAAAATGLINLPIEARNIIDDVNAVFAVIGSFYGVNLPASMRPPPGAPMVARPMSQGEMEKAVKAKIEALKQKLQ